MKKPEWMLSPKIRNKTKMSILGTSIQYCTGSSSQSCLKEMEIKIHPRWIVLGIPGLVTDIPKISYLWPAAAESLQSCLTLCDPIDGSPWGSPVPGILQARTLEWVAISFSNAWKWKVKVKSLSLVRLLVTPWTAAHQAPPCMGFSRQEYWSGVPLPSPSIVLETGIKTKYIFLL